MFGFRTGWIINHVDGGDHGERPLPQSLCKGGEAYIADLIIAQADVGACVSLCATTFNC